MPAAPPVLALALLFASSLSSSSRAAECDPVWAWTMPPADSSGAVDRAVNDAFALGLQHANARADAEHLSCRDVENYLVGPLAGTAFWYSLSSMRTWGMSLSPSTTTVYAERFVDESTLRDTTLLPFGRFVPPDPTLRVGEVLFSTDKLGHLLLNGLRCYDRVLQARARGVDEDDAQRSAIDFGVAQELGWMGVFASGVFSYADLEANWQGLQWWQGLCEGPAPGLAFVDGRWRLQTPFRIALLADPCFDEAWSSNSYRDPHDVDAVRRGIQQLCPRLTQDPRVQQRRAMYASGSCASFLARDLRARRTRGEIPAPSPLALDALCGWTPVLSIGGRDDVARDSENPADR